jgi:uncharacterized membrane protein
MIRPIREVMTRLDLQIFERRNGILRLSFPAEIGLTQRRHDIEALHPLLLPGCDVLDPAKRTPGAVDPYGCMAPLGRRLVQQGRTFARLIGMTRWLTLLQGLVVAAMFAAAALAWPYAPDSIPVHFGINGEANRYGGKPEGLLAMPLVALGVLILFKVLPRLDPLRERYAEFATPYGIATLAILVFLALAYATVLAAALGVALNPATVIVPLVGLLLMVVGSVLDRVRPNWFIGIRTPWTMSSERAWIATHRAGKWIFIGMGAVLVVAGLLQTAWLLYLAIVACILGTLGLVAYSYVVWRDDRRRVSPAGH